MGLSQGKWIRAVWLAMMWGMAGRFAPCGQSGLPAPPATVEEALHSMSDAAGVIFTGQVVRVLRVERDPGSLGVVEVEFLIDSAVRGCVTGQSYVVREWAGLWGAAEMRYRVGQRLLMLLRSPGVAGLSSPVGGMDGAIPIRGVVNELGSGGIVAAASLVTPIETVDLRWVAARMLRGVSYQAGLTSGASLGSVSGAGSVSGGAGSVASQGASVATVLGMLGDWEKVRVAR
jgi:hypothetical protein